jgi:hypothetical protein
MSNRGKEHCSSLPLDPFELLDFCYIGDYWNQLRAAIDQTWFNLDVSARFAFLSKLNEILSLYLAIPFFSLSFKEFPKGATILACFHFMVLSWSVKFSLLISSWIPDYSLMGLN